MELENQENNKIENIENDKDIDELEEDDDNSFFGNDDESNKDDDENNS